MTKSKGRELETYLVSELTPCLYFVILEFVAGYSPCEHPIYLQWFTENSRFYELTASQGGS